MLLSGFSHVWLCMTNPIDDSPPGSPVPGILQARTLEWVAISFSNAWKWKVKMKSLSRVRLLATPWTAAHQAPSMGFSRQESWSGVPLPSPGAIMIWCQLYTRSKYTTLSVVTNRKYPLVLRQTVLIITSWWSSSWSSASASAVLELMVVTVWCYGCDTNPISIKQKYQSQAVTI